MNSFLKSFSGLFLIVVFISCTDNGFNGEVEIPDFNFPQTVTFESTLSAYEIFEGSPSDLSPSEGYYLLELSAVLFTDFAYKQRLVKLPEGTLMDGLGDESIDFPDGTILTKTFFYYNDERAKDLGKRIIETRLEIKANDVWNVATYLWDQNQSDATLVTTGHDTQVSWINEEGDSISTMYHVPTENECMTCHQSDGSLSPLGPTLRNLNREIIRDDMNLNQLNYLQSVGILSNVQLNQVTRIADYKDINETLERRARSYIAMNCAHCHQPGAWEEPAERDFDFRYETSLQQTGILFDGDEIIEVLSEGEMPFIGTTLMDQEGISLVIDYIESL